tara:strand:- start:519 stop:1130 length:612 start_codon:yes stop_codon:yes gene_type:complete
MADFAKMIEKNIDEGIVGVTFCLNVRAAGGRKCRLEGFKEHCKSPTLHQGIKVTIGSLLRRHAKGKDVRCIYDVVYGGGESGKMTMITLLYSVNIPEEALVMVEKDMTDGDSKRNSSLYNAARRLKQMHGWKIGRKGYQIKLRTPEQDLLCKAVEQWESKWEQLDREQKEQIASEHGVSLRSFACMVSHKHGKLANKGKEKAS